MKHYSCALIRAALVALVLVTLQLTGRVIDPARSVVPGAEVIATNQETGITTRATSSAAGVYVLPLLEPGAYTITASAAGFKTYERKDVVVTAEAPLLKSADSTAGQSLNSRVVSEMPLSGRRALELVELAPGVIPVSYSGLAKPQFAISGGRAYNSAAGGWHRV
jgi:hypothetical protein